MGSNQRNSGKEKQINAIEIVIMGVADRTEAVSLLSYSDSIKYSNFKSSLKEGVSKQCPPQNKKLYF
jgi:hypothetical protein